MEGLKQHFRSQVKPLEAVWGVMGGASQHRQEIASRPTRQLFDELGRQYSRNSCEVGKFNYSHVHVYNSYDLPLHRRGEVTPVSITSGCPNAARTTTHQRVFAHTNTTTQTGVYNEPLLFVEDLEGTVHLPFRIGANR